VKSEKKVALNLPEKNANRRGKKIKSGGAEIGSSLFQSALSPLFSPFLKQV